MPSLKSLSSKMLGIKKRGPALAPEADAASGGRPASDGAPDLRADSPEAHAARAVRAFCESGGLGLQNGDEVTYLPTIVESAESSPTAAAECAQLVRKYLKRDHWAKPSNQYNALMLMRILADNPGPTFTRNVDGKFVDTLKELLRNGRDPSVRQMLMETLDQFELQKELDEGLAGVNEMWKKEKEKAYKAYGGRGPPPPPPPPNLQAGPGSGPPQADSHAQSYFAKSHSNKRLPDPVELTNRLEEARTSAKLLTQLVVNTPSTEVLDNDLIKEFADRCLSASRSIQGYMTAENPSPDNETMESLIDVNEELQLALNNQKRAMLSARKEHGGDRSQNPSPASGLETNGVYRPPVPTLSGAFAGAPAIPRRETPRQDVDKGKGREVAPGQIGYVAPPPGPPPGRSSRSSDVVSPISDSDADESDRNPFLDPHPPTGLSEKARGKSPVHDNAPVSPVEQPSLDYEPFHPGYSQPTMSYLGRQDSALDEVQMHGAVGGAGGSGAGRGPSAEFLRNDPYEFGESRGTEDLYSGNGAGAVGSSAAGQKPVYRY